MGKRAIILAKLLPMQLIYLIAYLCLLRTDEALGINMEHIEFRFNQAKKVVLTLDFRKTHQEGGEHAE